MRYFPILDAIRGMLASIAVLGALYFLSRIIADAKKLPEALKKPARWVKRKLEQYAAWFKKNPVKGILSIIVGAFVGAGLVTAAAAAGISLGVVSFVALPVLGMVAGAGAVGTVSGAFHECQAGVVVDPITGKEELRGCVG